MALLAAKDKDEEQEIEKPDHAAPLRADVLGSIAGSDPNSPGYLGKINHLITAHGAADNLIARAGGFSGMQMSQPSALSSPSPSPAPPTPTTMATSQPQQRGWLGKIGHGLARMGNIAGDVLAPGVMAITPGTDLNKRIEAGRTQARTERERELGVRETTAGAEKSRAETEAAREKLAESEAAKPAGQKWTVTKDFEGPNGEPVEIEEGSGVVRLAGSGIGIKRVEKPESEKAPPHITVMKGSQQHIMERDPKTGEYSIDRGIAAPNFAMVAPSLKTVDVVDPKTGLPTIQTLGGKTVGVSGTGAYGHEMEQAGAVDRAATDLISEINAHKGKLGNMQGIIESALLGTPWADPETAGLRSQIATFAALQPSMHGFRGKDALQQFEKILGGIPNNPDALIAAIQGITKTAGAINPALGGLKVGDIEGGYRYKGGDKSKKENWEEVKSGGASAPTPTPAPKTGGNPAPEGTVIEVGGARQVKRNGKWVAQ